MKIRGKLLLLLLFIALIPLLASSLLHRHSIRQLGSHLAQDTRSILMQNAHTLLHQLVDDFGATLERDRTLLRLTVQFQKREVEQRLAAPPSTISTRLYFPGDFERGTLSPMELLPSVRHYSPAPYRRFAPLPVSYWEQVVVLPKGIDQLAVAEDLARLSTMAEAYRFIHQFSHERIYQQHTTLESGVHTSFPGRGGFPAGFDPRNEAWYRRVKETGRRSIQVMPDLSSRDLNLVGALPVYRPDGAFAGVTAIDVPIIELFKDLKLPEEWAPSAERLIVIPVGQSGPPETRLKIIVRDGHQTQATGPPPETELTYLDSDDRSELAALADDVAAGKSGVRRMRFAGKDALWAYGIRAKQQPFPVIIVPHEPILAQAITGETYVLQQMRQGLQLTGGLLALAIAGVIVLAISRSRVVTSPIRRLAKAATQLAAGDFQAQARIETGDEFEELGRIFNDIGPKLKERDQMIESLAVAREVQQQLLPLQVPRLKGFDLFGASIYCDETGGDYFDFIPMGEGRIGIAVGDVTGHGVGAALLMASARGVLRSQAVGNDSDPGTTFNHLNRHLVRDTGDSFFMTLFFGIAEENPLSFRWVSGGHGPVLWLRKGQQEAVELPPTGIPLGIMEQTMFETSETLALEAGDIILVGTDGIWETCGAGGEMFGRDRLLDRLLSNRQKTARQIYTDIIDAVSAFRGPLPQEDDVTLVVLKVPDSAG